MLPQFLPRSKEKILGIWNDSPVSGELAFAKAASRKSRGGQHLQILQKFAEAIRGGAPFIAPRRSQAKAANRIKA
jgi:hypothetical protein